MGYYKKYESLEPKVRAFFQLRGVVARSVEALILLDRLAYVLEKVCTFYCAISIDILVLMKTVIFLSDIVR